MDKKLKAMSDYTCANLGVVEFSSNARFSGTTKFASDCYFGTLESINSLKSSVGYNSDIIPHSSIDYTFRSAFSVDIAGFTSDDVNEFKLKSNRRHLKLEFCL